MRLALILCTLCVICTAPLLASTQVTVFDPTFRGTIGDRPEAPRCDLVKQAIFVTVQAYAPGSLSTPRARQLAHNLAMAKARTQVQTLLAGMKLTGYATLGDVLAANLLADEDMTLVLNAVRPLAERWDSERHQVTLVCALPLFGAAAPSMLVSKFLGVEQQQLKKTGKPAAHSTEEMTLYTRTPAKQLSAGPYTGVILDCTGLKYTPALLPKLVTPDGVEIWGTAGVNAQLILEKGLAEPAASLRAAVASPRVGVMPLIIRPVGTCGALRGDLVLSEDDAQRLREQDAEAHFLATLSIVILTE